MAITTKTLAPGGGVFYIPQEHALAAEIKKYLVHMAAQLKTPIEVSIRARAQGIATDIRTTLLTHEQKFMPRKQELAAHEFADPHNALSIDAGRKELAEFIAGIAALLAGNTWAPDIHMDIKIGHELPAPFAIHGIAVCTVFDCKRDAVRHRFASSQETSPPSSENDIPLGMTLVCRPGKVGIHQLQEDTDRSGSMGLLQSDAALYRWTIQTLIIMENLQRAVDLKFGEEQQIAIREAGDALRANALVLRMKREKQATETAAALASAEAIAETLHSPESTSFTDELRRILNSVKHISSELGEAAERIEEEIKHSLSRNHTAAHAAIDAEEHKAARDMASEKPAIPHSPHAIHHVAAEPAPEER